MEDIIESPIIQRLKEYITTTGLTTTQFADKAGIPRPSFSQILSGRNKTISNQLLAKFHNSFPGLDILWLLFGRETAHAPSNIETSEPQNSTSQQPAKPYMTENQGTHDIDSTSNTTTPEHKQIENPEQTMAAEPKWEASVVCTPPSETPNPARRTVSSILIIYSDGTFESFLPSARQ